VSTCISDKNECKFKQLLRPVLWSQVTKTIKLIYAIQDITLMVISNISGTWGSGHNRTISGSDPDDHNGEVPANGNAPCVIEGDGNYMITGDADGLGYCKTFGDGP
jgi:hypothetical protein